MDSKKAYEQIKTILEHGMMAEVELKDGNFRVAHYMNADKSFVFSHPYKDVKKCYDYMSSYCWKTWEISAEVIKITPVPRKFKKYEVGQKVRVMENAREIEDFKKYGDQCMIGKIYEVEECIDWCSGIHYYLKSDSCCAFPHYCLAPVFEDEEETIETVEINGKKYNKSEVEDKLKELKPIK